MVVHARPHLCFYPARGIPVQNAASFSDDTPTYARGQLAPIVAYTGSSKAARVDAFNAKEFAASAWLAAARGPELLNTLVPLFTAPPSVDGVVDTTLIGPEGGSAVSRGVVSLSPQGRTGWISFEFDGYAADGWVLHGRLVLDVVQPISVISYSLMLELTNFSVSADGTSAIYNGIVAGVLVNNAAGYTRTLSSNILREDTATGEQIWAENLAAVRTRSFLFSFDETYTGRVYHSVHGYVDVSTDSPLAFVSNEPRPDRGGAFRVRGSNASTGLVPLNPDHVAVVLDEDDDAVDDRFARLTWEQLLEPAATAETHSGAVANAGARRLVAVTETVELNGLLSHDADHSFLTAEWTLAVKPLGSAAVLDVSRPLTPSFSPDIPGYYLFTVRAVDPDGDAHDAVEIQAVPFATLDRGVRMRLDRPAPAPLGMPVLLDAGMSRREELSDSAPFPVRHAWSLRAPPESGAALTDSTSPTTTFVPDVAGFYRIKVENDFSGSNRDAVASKVIGFDTGLQYYEAVHMAIDSGLWGDPVLADLDADGHIDIASLGTSENGWVIRVFLGTGPGEFRAAAAFPVDNSVTELLYGDLDGDGLQDLVTWGLETLYVVNLQDPIESSSFRQMSLDRGEQCGFGSSLWVAVMDTDGDGRADVLMADRCRLALSTWKHTSGGELVVTREQSISALAGLPVVFGDLNGDGWPDFVVPREAATSGAALLVFAQQGNGDFELIDTPGGRSVSHRTCAKQVRSPLRHSQADAARRSPNVSGPTPRSA